MKRTLFLLWAGVCLLLLLRVSVTSVRAEPPTAPNRQPPLRILSNGPALPFRAGYPADKGGLGYEEHNLLSVPLTRVAPEDKFSVDIRVYNDGGFDYFYNVYWNRLLLLPGAVALYDAKKHYIRDLMAFTSGSRVKAGQSAWTPIQTPGYAGTNVECGPLSVPPGTYYVQVIFFTSLVHPPPDRSDDGWPPLNDRTEIMRSEAVRITVVDPKAAQATVRAVKIKAAGHSRPKGDPSSAPMSAQAFEAWVKEADNKLDGGGKAPVETQNAVMRRLRASEYVTDDTVTSVVSTWEDSEMESAERVMPTYANTKRLITALQPLLYGRPLLQAYLSQTKGRLLRLEGSEAGAALEYDAALRLLTPMKDSVIGERMNALVERADALLAQSDKAGAEALYLEALSDDWYTSNDDQAMQTRRDLYVRAGRGLIACRSGDLQALMQIYFVPATYGELGPLLIAAIHQAGGTLPKDDPRVAWATAAATDGPFANEWIIAPRPKSFGPGVTDGSSQPLSPGKAP